MQFPHARIMVFAKAPIPGMAKTRLIPTLGAEGAARLQETLVRTTLSMVTGAQLAPVELWCSPDDQHPVFQNVIESGSIHARVQQGCGLGQRMQFAFECALAASPFAVLIGSDCPVMSPAYIATALQSLAAGTPAVLGPAHDGGYVLLGLRQVDERLFENVDWGTENVLTQTRSRLTALGWDWNELEPLWDLDRPEDLERLRETDGGFSHQRKS